MIFYLNVHSVSKQMEGMYRRFSRWTISLRLMPVVRQNDPRYLGYRCGHFLSQALVLFSSCTTHSYLRLPFWLTR